MQPQDTPIPNLISDIKRTVRAALEEDIGSGDITAQLIPADRSARARVITREACTVCGRAWVEEVFHQLDPDLQLTWHCEDGDQVAANAVLFELTGNARAILTGERTALNFLQTLSGTATTAAEYAARAAGTQIKILDTRKTIPGLRTAQKYAVLCGGCHNHRIGLYDAFLIKENHIAAAGGIDRAIAQAKKIKSGALVEVEVENLDELRQALDSGADVIMLDEFSDEDTRTALSLAKGKAKIEISGSVDSDRLQQLAKLEADYISSGSLTKHLRAIDLSLRIDL
ncbi:carboxylating nicotinate-nucleotide diphosphorylase [Microbulbifer thermotolerans]|uniref:Probable nicotinate-nucleotide pyrophosphorylase [carboxylating] n=1 Tax=Microbulbifer thermotolerans TaxID=252514 RepID=A0A143HMV6_MICTH|nr:carboxylating nicotinate-nucleotide diphosphorylase [Microbulbifer thermotolerans]AMX03029.1 nicotinate-nucleotide diphosphorylase (carboxylating) [Microbulbifer thermotolerans]MCX2781502.1 carboxylating nicotinate-nucleotide diphosphorylase [Microbulbifer thermotolerans]MCX2802017.1 carboxylating nicotinate-nucleotide diphosphorylase [Microbulbifer thermotolerans]MCX2831403.1 carboxylating nicotinate-nucleotide diphosphorylase [Microbulbifer thermotolerans]SFC69921.1 nicotinate-nucleotide 